MILLAEAAATWQTVLLEYGPLGVFALVVLIAIGWAGSEYWKIKRPHLIAMQEVTLKKEAATVLLFDTLRELEPQKVDILKRQQTLTESIREDQLAHAAECGDTKKTVREIHQMVVKLAGHT
jgi:hypothetical protein